MKINDVLIDDTYAEAFNMYCSEVLITAATEYYAKVCAEEATGFGTSIIGCPSESGIDMFYGSEHTPDYRPGYSIMICTRKPDVLKEQLIERVGECVLTAPTTAMFNWTPFERKDDKTQEQRLDVKLHFFGDGYESKTVVNGRNCWKIPIMGGEFVCEEEIGYVKGVGGGNFFIMGETQASALMAAQAAVDAIHLVPGIITPFAGGIVAGGSKVGSNKYAKFLKVSTNEKMCPSIRDRVPDTQIPEGVKAVFEIVIDGMNPEVIRHSMKHGISAACTIPGVVKISAGNYGGKLGPHKFPLQEIMQG